MMKRHEGPAIGHIVTRAAKRFMLVTTMVVVAGVFTLPLETETGEAAAAYPPVGNKPAVSAKITAMKKNGQRMNLRLEADQSVFGYDTLQGSCYGNGHIYYLLYNRSKDRCKVVRMKRSSKKVTGVSRPLKLYHGNDITYNTRTRRLVVAHAKPDRKTISVINPRTLKVVKRVSVSLPKKLAEENKKRLKKKGGYNGFSSIAYNAKHRQYVVQLYSMRDFLILDEKFRPVRYIVPDEWERQVYQGIDSFGDRIVVCNSPKGRRPYNVLSVYDWDGHYLSQIKLNRRYEAESVFHVGSSLYVGFYRAHVENYRWVLKTKTVRKKGKRVRVRYYGKKWGRYLNRDSYLYRVTGL